MLTGSIELRGPFFARAESVLAERLGSDAHSAEERAVAEVLRRAFSPEREARYPSVQEFRVDLADAIDRWAG